MTTNLPANPEAIFTYGAPQLKFGPGASDEIGFDLSQYGARRVLIVTDAGVAGTGAPQRVADQMAQFGIEARVFNGVHVEPTDTSLEAAVAHARESGPWDAFVAVGGGSSIDTAKAINLMLTNPGELMDYINVPVGKGAVPVNPLRPLVAVPTTTGTGAESTTVCVLDVLALKVKTGISHARLRPTLAVIDPALTVYPASRRDRLGRHGHRLPRAGELHRALVHDLRAQAARAAGALLRLEPGLGHVVGEGAAAAGGLVPHRRARGQRPAGAH